ncbi:MAG: hypothetical protein AAF298_07435 [Cyanobacteria bacterium P01_A01_bin.40]
MSQQYNSVKLERRSRKLPLTILVNLTMLQFRDAHLTVLDVPKEQSYPQKQSVQCSLF